MIEKGAGTADLAVAEVVDDPIRRLDLDAAASSTSLNPTQHEHAVAEIAKLARDQDELLPGIVQTLEVLFDALASPG